MSTRKHTFVWLAIVAVLWGVKAAPPQKIVNGQRAAYNEFRYLVSLRLKPYYVHHCGGAIISRQHILTAAHCLDKINFRNMEVAVGTNDISRGGSFYSLKAAAVHKQYKGFKYDSYNLHDIAVLTLATPLKSSDPSWSIIKLASKEYLPGWPAVVAGWGNAYYKAKIKTRYLMKLHTKLAEPSVCARNIRIDRDYQVCTLPNDGTGFCQGDSGGPIVVNGEVVGVVSFSRGCGQVASVYLKVRAYKNFIERATGITM